MDDIIRVIPNEYTPVRSLLHMALSEHSTYSVTRIQVIVSDAIMMTEDVQYRLHADRRVYKYSSYLSKHKSSIVRTMNPSHLSDRDFATLLEIFENL